MSDSDAIEARAREIDPDAFSEQKPYAPWHNTRRSDARKQAQREFAEREAKPD